MQHQPQGTVNTFCIQRLKLRHIPARGFSIAMSEISQFAHQRNQPVFIHPRRPQAGRSQTSHYTVGHLVQLRFLLFRQAADLFRIRDKQTVMAQRQRIAFFIGKFCQGGPFIIGAGNGIEFICPLSLPAEISQSTLQHRTHTGRTNQHECQRNFTGDFIP